MRLTNAKQFIGHEYIEVSLKDKEQKRGKFWVYEKAGSGRDFTTARGNIAYFTFRAGTSIALLLDGSLDQCLYTRVKVGEFDAVQK